MRSRRRGFTMIEMMMATVLAVIVLGTLVSVYGYTMARTARTVNSAASILQGEGLMDVIEAQASQAISCTVVTSGGNAGLKCVMPNSGLDRDGDGLYDDYYPSGVTKRQIATYTAGNRVWFYMSSNGNFTSLGTKFYCAVRTDDSLPTSSNVISSFSNRNGGSYKWGLIDRLSFSASGSKAVKVSVRGSSQAFKDVAIGSESSESNDSYVMSLSRTIAWRNWWQ